jgi:hypothetical protein
MVNFVNKEKNKNLKLINLILTEKSKTSFGFNSSSSNYKYEDTSKRTNNNIWNNGDTKSTIIPINRHLIRSPQPKFNGKFFNFVLLSFIH